MDLITSIPPTLHRLNLNGADVGTQYFSSCVQSWKEHGFLVRTLNRACEAQLVRERFGLEPIVFSDDADDIFPEKFGPSFGTITKNLKLDGAVGVVNADICILPIEKLISRLEELTRTAFVFAHRTEVLTWPGPLHSTYTRGADFVAFRPDRITEILTDPVFSKLKLGLYWWDRVLPIAASFFIPVLKIGAPFAAHHSHGGSFDKALYNSMLLESFDILGRLSKKQRLLNPAAASFAGRIERLDSSTQAGCTAFARLCSDWMDGKLGGFSDITLRLNLEHETLEGMLRTTLKELTATRETIRKQSHTIIRLNASKRRSTVSSSRPPTERLAEAWLALNYNWDLNVLRGSSSATVGEKGAYRIMNFAPLLYQFRPKIDVVHIEEWSRFGNSVMQLLNAFYMAERLGAQAVAFPQPHAFFSGNCAGKLRLVWNSSDLTYSGPRLVGNFFQLKAFRQTPTPRQVARVFLELIRPLLLDEIRERDLRVEDDDLVLHFRSGDAFAGPMVPRNHGQPPLSYYLSAVEHEKASRVWLVFEDRSNPCIAATEAALQSRGIQVFVQSGALADDLRVLLSARRMVAGRGTFIHMVAHLSERLEKLYIFEHGAQRMQPLRQLGVEVILARDARNEYKAKLLSGNWAGSPAQHALMLSYPAESLQFSTVKKSAPRFLPNWIHRAFSMWSTKKATTASA
jgi:hypothetical protein